MARYTTEETRLAIETLRELLKPGDTVYTVLTHVSYSGMSRSIDLFLLADSDRTRLTYFAARAMRKAVNQKYGGIRIRRGPGIGNSVVYNLGRTLWPDGFDCIGDRCPSTDHANGDQDFTPHRHKDGGYALRREWL